MELGLVGTFSPPAWGWSAMARLASSAQDVFPTRVGMVRKPAARPLARHSFPHPRGDGPPLPLSRVSFLMFSPPAWGWSGISRRCHSIYTVFPTRVGMVRIHTHADSIRCCFPHPRGDGPVVVGIVSSAASFPHPRGDGPGLD